MSETGYVNKDIMLKWGKHFCKTKATNSDQPTLLLLDGHGCHVSNPELLEYLAANVVEVYALPPHTSHAIQPLDKVVFKSLKSAWTKICSEKMKLNPNAAVLRSTFFQCFTPAWQQCATVENAQRSFRSSGIIPLDFSAIPESFFDPSLSSEQPHITSDCVSNLADLQSMLNLNLAPTTVDILNTILPNPVLKRSAIKRKVMEDFHLTSKIPVNKQHVQDSNEFSQSASRGSTVPVSKVANKNPYRRLTAKSLLDPINQPPLAGSNSIPCTTASALAETVANPSLLSASTSSVICRTRYDRESKSVANNVLMEVAE